MKPQTPTMQFEYIAYLIDLKDYPEILEEFDNFEGELNDLILKYQSKFLTPQNILAAFCNEDDAEQFCYNYEIPDGIRFNYYTAYAKIPSPFPELLQNKD